MPDTATRIRPALLLLLIALCGAPVLAQEPPLPSGREIIARHVAAIGGEEAYRSIKSVTARGRWEIPQQRITGTMELQSARPNKLLYRVTVAGIGRIENGYNGRVGWTLSPLSGPEVLVGRRLSGASDEAWFDGTLHLPQYVPEVTTEGLAVFDNRPAYKVRVVFASGNQQTEYFDVETGLQLGTEAVRATPQGDVPTVNVLRNYQPFGPVLQPTVFIQRALGFEQVVTITSCEYDTVSPDAFDPPAEIRALLAE